MYIVFCTRLVKVNTGTTEKFAPRTANREEPSCIGPFSSLRAATRAAVNASSTHTCLSAVITDANGAEKMLAVWPYLSHHVAEPIHQCIAAARHREQPAKP